MSAGRRYLYQHFPIRYVVIGPARYLYMGIFFVSSTTTVNSFVVNLTVHTKRLTFGVKIYLSKGSRAGIILYFVKILKNHKGMTNVEIIS